MSRTMFVFGMLAGRAVAVASSGGGMGAADAPGAGVKWADASGGAPRIETPDMARTGSQRGAIRYVDDDAAAGGDGQSWLTAYQDMEVALAEARGDPGITEIRVAGGLYLPSLRSQPDTPRTECFQLVNGVTLRGGYAGLADPDQSDTRDLVAYEVVLSGDLGGNDDPEDFPDGPSYDENAYHVFFHPKELALDATAVLDGLTITGGNADGTESRHAGGGMHNERCGPSIIQCTFRGNAAINGGGLYNLEGDPVVASCTFESNWSALSGGGMANVASSPTITGSTFSGNRADAGDGGGGMYNHAKSSPALIDCQFIANSAGAGGGGIHNRVYSSPTLTGCTIENNTAAQGGGMYNLTADPHVIDSMFRGNSAVGDGGAVYCSTSNLTMSRSTFTGNSASGNGGGLYATQLSNANLTNCLLGGNAAGFDGGGVRNDFATGLTLTLCTVSDNSAGARGGGLDTNGSLNPNVTNSVFWGNVSLMGSQIYGPQSAAVVRYTCIQGGHAGQGNFDANPSFVAHGYWDDHGTPDESGDDFWVPGDYHLRPDSPCINAGSNDAVPPDADVDFDGDERIQHCRVDVGFDETPFIGRDCNGNGVSDACELAADPDCNGNGVLDECEGPIVYVDYSAGGANNGTSWVDAYTDLQDAIAGVLACPGLFNEIRVAGGTYRSGTSREDSFRLINGVTLSGGYRGVDSSTPGDPDDRDIAAFETVLSGDLAGNDDPDQFPFGSSRLDNSACVFFHPAELALNHTAVLDGFTISGGRALANYFPRDHGGGMYNIQSSPTVQNCTFRWNSSEYSGGGMSNEQSSPTIVNCIFQANSADESGGGIYNEYSDATVTGCSFIGNASMGESDGGPGGGGMGNHYGSPSVEDCTFSQNSAFQGGGISNYYSAARVTRCIFEANEADYGAGAHNVGYENDRGSGPYGSPVLTQCLFRGNIAALGGGGAYNYGGQPVLANCIFAGNTSGNVGGGILNGYGMAKTVNCVLNGNRAAGPGGAVHNAYTSGPTVTNSILWKNFSPIGTRHVDKVGTTTTTYSCVEGGSPGIGNIKVDPRFVSLGHWEDGGTPDDWDDDVWVDGDYHLQADSPCINAGSNDAVPTDLLEDIDGEGRIQHCRVDMGVDETPYFRVDCNANGVADACDIAGGAADTNGNGIPDECEPTACGDGGVWEGIEQCDDGGESPWCDADCTFAICGDGVVNATAGEACDGDAAVCPPTYEGGPSMCRAECTCAPSTCGNDVRDLEEACDGDDSADCRSGECQVDCTCVPADVTEIYRNTNPLEPPPGGFAGQVFARGAGLRVSDDLVTTAFEPCPLSEVVVQVHGGNFELGVFPGFFNVTLGVWTACPNTDGTLLPGTTLLTYEHLEDNVLHDLVIPLPSHPTPPTTTIWVSGNFSTNEAGFIVGSPPELGFSRNGYDDPIHACTASLGGDFPAFPHASFAAQVFAEGSCETHHLAYSALDETADSFDRGRNIRIADDIQLTDAVCELSSYEIMVLGSTSNYNVRSDLRIGSVQSGPLNVIPGTEATFLGVPNQVQFFRATFPPGIFLRKEEGLWMTWNANRNDTGLLLTGDTQVGHSTDVYAWEDPVIGWQIAPFPGAVEGIFAIAINCRGEAPLGACCRQSDENSGETGVCTDQITAAECLFGRWAGNASPTDLALCAYEQWDPPCGSGACCIETETGLPACENLSKNACEARTDCTGQGCLGFGGVWEPDRFCGERGQRCFRYPCYFADNDCGVEAPEIVCVSDADCPANRQPCKPDGLCDLPGGCMYLDCCDRVCTQDPSCCASVSGGWDAQCACLADDRCAGEPSNAQCWEFGSRHAREIELTWDGERWTGEALACALERPRGDVFGPDFCCSKAGVAEPGYGTLWYYFTAPENGSARITTCHTPDGADQDSILQVFRESPEQPGSWTSLELACNNLGAAVACNDDSGCGADGLLSDICLTDLRTGELVLVIIAAPTQTGAFANYTLTIESPCEPETAEPAHSYCHGAVGPIEGSPAGIEDLIPFDCTGEPGTLCLENASFNCPGEPQLEAMKNDVWADYQPACTGTLRVTTCEPDGPSPETTLAMYRADPASGALCPGDGGILYRANDDAPATLDESQFNTQRCSLGAETCATADDCVIPNAQCTDDGDCVLSCATDAECAVNGLPAGWCMEGRCERPCDTDADCPLKACSIRGNLCTLNSDCNTGITSWSHKPCEKDDPTTFPRVCRNHPNTICTVNGGECEQGDICIAQTCNRIESCDPEVCQSRCWPGSAITVPVSHLETYKVRLGGEYGTEPIGTLRLTCTEDDCNVNAVPDVCELSCGVMDGLCIHFSDCGTALDVNVNGTPDECEARVVSWASVATHGVYGPIGLPIPGDGSFTEPRHTDTTKLVVTYDGEVAVTDTTAVTIQSCNINGMPADLSATMIEVTQGAADEVVITFTPALPGSGLAPGAHDPVRYLVVLIGVGGAFANTSREFTVVLGDAFGLPIGTGDARVNAQDNGSVRMWAAIGVPFDPGDVAQVRADVYADGDINAMDQGLVRSLAAEQLDGRGLEVPCP